MSETAKSPRSGPPATGGFEDATRERLRLRMAIDGPSGSGKSVTAQRFGIALAKAAAALAGRAENDLRIATICSENRSARKYVGMDFGDGPFRFKVKELAHFAPTEYTSAIEVAGNNGFEVLVIDGLSQAWEGKEGALELVDRAGGNRFTAWKDVTPMHRRMVDAILNSPCHVIVTMRAKTEYVLEPDEHGKQVPRRLGTAPIQRSGMEYEFDLYGSMNWDHILTITKSRCPAMDGRIFHKPGELAMAPVIAWLNTGECLADGPVVRFITDKQME